MNGLGKLRKGSREGMLTGFVTRRFSLLAGLLMAVVYGAGTGVAAQEVEPQIHVVVNMVQLNVAVTDHKGNSLPDCVPRIS